MSTKTPKASPQVGFDVALQLPVPVSSRTYPILPLVPTTRSSVNDEMARCSRAGGSAARRCRISTHSTPSSVQGMPAHKQSRWTAKVRRKVVPAVGANLDVQLNDTWRPSVNISADPEILFKPHNFSGRYQQRDPDFRRTFGLLRTQIFG